MNCNLNVMDAIAAQRGGGDIGVGASCPADYSIETKGTVGLALRAQFIPSLRWGGVGISPYVNINPEYTFAKHYHKSCTWQDHTPRVKGRITNFAKKLLCSS